MAYANISGLRPIVTQTVATGAASATVTNTFSPQTYIIRISSTNACYFKIVEAAGGTATATDNYLPPSWVDYIVVTPGQKIAAIQAPTSGVITASVGVLNISEMA